MMICPNCKKYGIYWNNLSSNPYTYCPHCHKINCQMHEEQKEKEEEMSNWQKPRYFKTILNQKILVCKHYGKVQ